MRLFFSLFLLLSVTFITAAQEYEDDDSQASLRRNSVTIQLPDSVACMSEYPFINYQANHITMNGADWSSLIAALNESDSSGFRILHIGDSHIQADVLTGKVRDNLQQIYGSGGRGLVAPLKIAGTNEPYSYTFTTDNPGMTAKLLSVPWLSDMRFTGASFTPRSMKYSITLNTSVSRNPEGRPFNKVRLYSRGRFFIDRITDGAGIPLTPVVLPTTRYVDIVLPVSVTAVKLNLHSFEDVSFSGAALYNGSGGLLYHAIGNNGACFSNYNRIENFGRDVATLKPDLIIISMGTNEAFGNISDYEFTSDIDIMLREIRKYNPDAKILLTTPMECQRTSRSSRRLKNGRRRYYGAKKHSVNQKVSHIASLIRRYGEKNSIPVYDFYTVAGGNGASDKWVENSLMSSDRIHLSFPGYYLAGDLLTDALLSAFGNNAGSSSTRESK